MSSFHVPVTYSPRTPTRNGGHKGVGAQLDAKRTAETGRDKARREAYECNNALRFEGFQLDGFNLLGVVANPRAGMPRESRHSVHGTPSRPSPSDAGDSTLATQSANPNSSQAPATPASARPESSATDAASKPSESGMFSDAVSSLEFTLGQVTDQIETLNLFLEELSRQYLGDDAGESMFLEHYYKDDENEVQLPVPPPELESLQLADFQSYLEKCGVLAHTLFAQGIETTSLTVAMADSGSGSPAQTESPSAAVTMAQAGIPELFSQEDFDLTDSSIFVQFLLNDTTSLDGANGGTDSKADALYQPTHELVPVREQDTLASHLDRVELALQEKVRIKAGAFFQETTRFRQLSSSTQELLEQVQTLRRSIRSVLAVYGDTKDILHHQLQEYESLVELMDTAMELVQTKASVGGLLSANDYLGAAQQIQYGRRMLQGTESSIEQSNGGDAAVPLDVGATGKARLPLQQLAALSTCGQQFQQYESLIVKNLSEEIVDVFFHWRPSEASRLQVMVDALNLCDALPKAGELYQRRVQETVRMTVRTTIAEFVESSRSSGSGVTGMTYSDFFNCLELLMEELQTVLVMAQRVDEFCEMEKLFGDSPKRWTKEALASGADLASKSIAELLRLRKEAHSLINLEEMKQLWDKCLEFTLAMEGYNNDTKAVGLRSTLLGQVKAFLDRTHESNMTGLVAALDSEPWTPCAVSPERQAMLTRLCTGRVAINVSSDDALLSQEKSPAAEVEGVHYKVVWSCLLLVEMVCTNLAAAVQFRSLAANVVAKVTELLRLFNTRTTQLVLGAGAIHSAARLPSINAKHLSMVTQCLRMMNSLLPHIRASLMNQLPEKQHTLLNDLDKIKKEYSDHNEKVLNKFVTIIGGIVEHGLAPEISKVDFDARAKAIQNDDVDQANCCAFLTGIANNTKKMHQVLSVKLPPDQLQDVFSRIFAYVDQQVPALFVAAASNPDQRNGGKTFSFPATEEGKKRFILEVESTTRKLNSFPGVFPWDFTCMNVLARKMDYAITSTVEPVSEEVPTTTEETTAGESEAATENGESTTSPEGTKGQ
eukprot:Nitzschia sp. Nitz4//scaffold12_size214221//178747//182011//NITZ4_001528-RA/size214221-augustus-gene-0.36-mRNA-1//-1//CDS//3329535104//952//frame0